MGFSSGSTQSNNSSSGTSQSSNQAFPQLSQSLAPVISNGASGSSAIANLLGINGSPAQTNGFNNYLNSSGYNFVKQQGQDGLTSSAASSGLLGSGSFAKGLTDYNSKLSNTYLQNYLTNLGSLNTAGVQAGGVLSSSGGQSSSESASNGRSSGSNTSFTSG